MTIIVNMDFYTIIAELNNIGFYDLVLPFALFFAITYAVLKQFGIFHGEKVGDIIPTLISITVAIYATLYTPFGQNLGVWLTQMFGKMGSVLAGVLVFVVLVGMTGFNFPEMLKGTGKGRYKYNNIAVIICLLVALAIVYTSGFDVSGNFNIDITSESMLTLLLLGGVGLVIYFVTRKKDDDGDGSGGGEDTTTVTEEKPPEEKKK